MNKQSKRINNETIKFINKTYEALSVLKTQREDIRYFNYDNNDELIDESVDRMYELLDDMYHKSIDKKAGCIIKKDNLKPKKLIFQDCKDSVTQTPQTPSPRTPSPRTPVRNKIKVEIIDEDVPDVLETIMYSSEEENSSDDEDDWAELINLSKHEASRLEKELSIIRMKIAEYEGRESESESDEEFEKVNDSNNVD